MASVYTEERYNLRIHVLSSSVYNDISSDNNVLSNEFYIVQNGEDNQVRLGKDVIADTNESKFNTILSKINGTITSLRSIV